MFDGRNEYEETYRDGETIVREGDEGREMFIIQDGEVVVTKLVGGQEMELAHLPRGSFFGEMSLLESLPRTATVRAVGKTRVLVIRPGALLLKIRRDPSLALEMLQHMSGRIRDIDERFVELLASGSVSDETSKQLRAFRESTAYRILASRP